MSDSLLPEASDAPSALDERIEEALALLLVASPASPVDVAARVAALASAFDDAAATRALRRLAHLGLVRVASIEAERPSFVQTTLGREYGSGLPPRSPELASRLAELEELRTDFVATIAHELKTPLTAIRTCVGLLTDPDAEMTGTIRERLSRRIAASAEGMHHLIEGLLDLARYRSGNLRLEPTWVDANELAREADELLSPLLEQRQQVIHLDLPRTATFVFVDRRRLLQALGNILSNAQRFSPDGAAIELSVRRRNDSVAWEVRDHGPGISDEDQRHLFERFFRGRSDVEGGSGLGLPIALATAQAHGGRIDVETALGQGSAFRIVIPARTGRAVEGDIP